ncbi:2Fe-2S iron-sulfur cluster-binding protein [Shewanella donghaensis]|uniref:2Fe-2S iron-sulfur cluster-binding protein n=1 Tax=Shewanella donghaensis TaxID=238836 RepID=UPI001184447D|nr:2Fe-2S iron-sulfur cluster-binding protein [Shewanella donghaensis]
MMQITFITQENTPITVEADFSSGAQASRSVMELAVENNIDGIDGDCGGVCSCATCHVYVAKEHIDKTGTASEIETDMLELDDNANELSRLCCQIALSETLDGLVLTVAPS